MKKGLVFLLFLYLVPLQAQAMSNSSYSIDINSDPVPTPTPYTIPESKDLQNPKVINGNGFLALLSYDDDYSNSPLTLILSTHELNFGDLIPGEPLIRTQSLSVITGSNYGYELLISEDHNLSTKSASIPDTSCDSGNCTNVIPDIWLNPLTFGFGYRCDDQEGKSCVKDFASHFYKRLSNESNGEVAIPVLSSISNNRPTRALLSYKLNIAGSQAQNQYQNIVKYNLIPLIH